MTEKLAAQEAFMAHSAAVEAGRKALEEAGVKRAYSCPDVDTCAVGTREMLEAGEGFCIRCSRRVKPDLFVPKKA